MRQIRRLALSIAPILAVLACGGGSELAPPPTALSARSAPPPAPVAPPPVLGKTPGEVGVDVEALDRKADPCQNFYQFACGGWMSKTPIPDDQPAWTRSFNVIRERNETMLKEFLEKDATSPGAEPYAKALGDFYASCMDEAGIENQGMTALKPELQRIASVSDLASLAQEIARLHGFGVHVVFTYDSQQDFQDATQMIAVVSQSGLGLPDRDYYLEDSPKKKELRAKYETHVEKMLQLLDDSPAVAKNGREAVMRIETALAKAQMSKVDLRDPKKIYHRMDLASVKQTAPTFPWDLYVKDIGAPGAGVVNLAQPDYAKAVSDMLKNAPLADFRAYLRWHLVRYAAPRLPARFVDENFTMQRALTGTAKLPPRWKRCVRVIDAQMGEALGRPFVTATLGDEGKNATRTLIKGIESGMKENLQRLAWMDSPTRARAVEKVEHIANKIGFPDKWRNYDALKIDRTSYLGNVMRSNVFEYKRQLDKIGKPVDRSEWYMSPPTVNAYYDASMNEMVFPAGILQPPFYSNRATLPLNYGGIGMVMGHEVTHGFDDEGRQFDAKGNMTDWWTEQVSREFDRRAKCVADQYEGYFPVPDAHINGKLTLGENIADLGGVRLAFAALKKARAGQPMTEKDGFNEDQQFFLGFAQGWCTNMREEMLRLMVATNPHSPASFRVIGPLSNLSEFASAFSCKEGQPMVRPAAQRCEVW